MLIDDVRQIVETDAMTSNFKCRCLSESLIVTFQSSED